MDSDNKAIDAAIEILYRRKMQNESLRASVSRIHRNIETKRCQFTDLIEVQRTKSNRIKNMAPYDIVRQPPEAIQHAFDLTTLKIQTNEFHYQCRDVCTSLSSPLPPAVGFVEQLNASSLLPSLSTKYHSTFRRFLPDKSMVSP